MESHWYPKTRNSCGELIDEHVLSKMTSVRYSQILINTEINRLSRKASKKPQKYWDHYTSIKKKCQIECRKAYKNYVSTMLSDDIKSNPNRLWSFIKSKRCDSTGVAPFTKGGSLEKANIFNSLHQVLLRRIQLMYQLWIPHHSMTSNK
jgi:hypothetical protein